MKAKISPAAVGMFILGALLLFVIGFLSFGGSNIFVKPTRFAVYFDESVSGLDPGAPMKFNGVRIGRVAAVGVRYDADTRRALVRTTCEINRNVLTDRAGQPIDLTNPKVLRSLVEGGLRARLNFTGITGLLYVELSFQDPAEYPAPAVAPGELLPVVPAFPSPISELQESLVQIAANLKEVDFAGLAKDLRGLLANTNRKIAELDLQGLGDRVGRTADAVREFLHSPDAERAFANLNLTLEQARATLLRIDGQVGPAGAELRKTLAEAQGALHSLAAAAESTQQFVQAQGDVGDEVTFALRQLADAAAAMQRLADLLSRNPNALLVGKSKP